jgi:hypothetical protein
MSKLSQVTAHECVAQSDDLSQLDPQVLEHRLGDLIRRYVRGRSTVLAHSVVHHIEALICHPDVRDPALFCSYRRLATHWRWLAAQHNLSGVV